MASGHLECVLSSAECLTISDSIRVKIEHYLKKQEESLASVKIQHAKLQTQSEQKCFELNVQFQQVQEQTKKDEQLINALTTEKNLLENRIATFQQEQKELENKMVMCERNLQELKRDRDALELDKDELTSLLSRRNDDLDRLTMDLRTLTDQLVLSNKEKCEALIKTEELNSKQLALEYKEKRLDQERDLLVRQQQYLQEELEKRTKDILNIRREKTSKVLELQAELSEKIDEIKLLHRNISELTSTNESQQNHIKELAEEMKVRAENELKISENHRHELRSQTRLVELYKASSEDAQTKADELTKATEELQRLLREASTRYGELETSSKAEVEELKQKLEQERKAIEELQKELERANTLLDTSKSRVLTEECIETMSPSAAAASRLLKSGMTLTQIYSQYVSVSEQLLFKEEENKRLNSYIDQILQEIETRAPAMARQREDYEKSLEMVASLTSQLELAAEEAETERQNASEARRQMLQMERSHQRYQKQVQDLGAQVRFLLREIEILKGNRVPDRSDSEMEVSSSDGSAAQVISRHLVTFRDIEEIQRKNQELLNVVRELSEKQDEAENNSVDTRTAKIQQALERALGEIESLRETRRRHEELMESVVQQRDMYRKLVQEAGLNTSQSPSKFRSDLVTSTPAMPSKSEGLRSSFELEKLLSETNTLLQQSEQKYIAAVKEKHESEKELRDKIDCLNDQLAETRSQNARVATQIQYMEEKEKLLQGNLDSCKKQLHSLEEKNKTSACTIAKHEHSLAVLKDEALNAQQNLSRSEVTVSLLREEKQLLKDAEQRLLLERDSLLSERRSQGLLHANLESIKLNLERAESENKMRLQNSITSLEQQCELLRKKLDVEEERYRQTVKSFEDRIRMDQTALKTAEDRAAKAEATAGKLQEMLNATEMHPHISSPIRKGEVSRLLSSTAASENDQVNELRSQLTESKADTDKLREQLELVKQQAEQYRAIADSMEEELKKGTEASQSFRQEMEQHMANVTQDRDSLALKLQQVQEKLNAMEEEATSLRQEKAHQAEEVSRQINHFESELKAIGEKLKMADEYEAKARQECLDQAKASQEAQEKYERELVQHAAAVEQLNAAREALEERRIQTANLIQNVARLEEELSTGKSSWELQKSTLEKQAADLTARCADLDKQVDLMQQQIVTMSTRMTAVTRVQEVAVKSQGEGDADKSLNVSVGDEETRSSEQLLELIRFLRREKEIAISRFEVTEAETLRLRTQLEQIQRQLADAQASLQHERERSATSTLTSSKHTELLRKLETLNALTDSNRLLREERTALATQKDELISKLSTLEVEMQPLRDASRDLNNRIEELNAENQTLRKQVVAWKTRTTSLQERAGRATADDIKRLQQEKDQLQKQLDLAKEASAKSTTVLTEFQRTNGQLLAAQQKQLEEIKKLKEEAQQLTQKNASLQEDIAGAEGKRKEEEAKVNEKVEALRRIARKYKAQYEEIKTAHDKMVSEQASTASTSSALTASTSTEGEGTPSAEAAAVPVDTADAAKLKEVEERNTQLESQMEQLKKDYETLQGNDEKTKGLLKSCRAKISSQNKEKETLSKELQEAKAKIESLEQSLEEANVRATALRSQLEGRLARLERENNELIQAKQAVDSEMEANNQRIPVLQRQLEAYQKQLAFCQQQQQQQQMQQSTQQVVKTATGAEKAPAENNPPTANIKPMTSGASAIQRPPVTAPSQPSGTTLAHRTTPTASIRPMAMPSRTAAVQPTATISVSPMTPVAVATPTPVVPSASATPAPHQVIPVVPAALVVTRDEGIVAASEPTPSTSGASSDVEGVRKRTRTEEAEQTAEEQEQKRTRVESEELEEGEHIDEEEEEGVEEDVDEVEVIDTVDNSVQGVAAEDANRVEEVELIADDDNEDGLIESEEDKEEDEGEEDEEVVDVEEQRDEAVDSNLQMEVTDNAEEEEAVAPAYSVETASVDDMRLEHVAEESVETEAFGAPVAAIEPPAAAPAAAPAAEPSDSHPPARDDRLPSIGRNTLPYEDGGDDGIVPSTPVLLRPRPNDGFAEAVSSPQVGNQFVFGSGPEDGASNSGTGAQQEALSHLSEAQGMDDTRIDLTQLEESTMRSVPSTSRQESPVVEISPPNVVLSANPLEPAVVPVIVTVTPAEEQGEFEAGQDYDGDAAVELDLLGEDELREHPVESVTSSTTERRDGNEAKSTSEDPSSLEEASTSGTASSVSVPEKTETSDLTPSTSSQPVAVRPPPSRRGTGFTPRGRGISREDPLRAGTQRPVPITWSPGPNPPTFNPAMSSRGAFRRAPAGTPVMPMSGGPAVIQEPGAIHSPRARRARGRQRAGRRM